MKRYIKSSRNVGWDALEDYIGGILNGETKLTMPLASFDTLYNVYLDHVYGYDATFIQSDACKVLDRFGIPYESKGVGYVVYAD